MVTKMHKVVNELHTHTHTHNLFLQTQKKGGTLNYLLSESFPWAGDVNA